MLVRVTPNTLYTAVMIVMQSAKFQSNMFMDIEIKRG